MYNNKYTGLMLASIAAILMAFKVYWIISAGAVVLMIIAAIMLKQSGYGPSMFFLVAGLFVLGSVVLSFINDKISVGDLEQMKDLASRLTDEENNFHHEVAEEMRDLLLSYRPMAIKNSLISTIGSLLVSGYFVCFGLAYKGLGETELDKDMTNRMQGIGIRGAIYNAFASLGVLLLVPETFKLVACIKFDESGEFITPYDEIGGHVAIIIIVAVFMAIGAIASFVAAIKMAVYAFKLRELAIDKTTPEPVPLPKDDAPVEETASEEKTSEEVQEEPAEKEENEQE